MPGAGDGFTVVSAMRHTNENAITLVFTGYPALKEAMQAILLQADEILVKPMQVDELVELIRERIHSGDRDAPKRSPQPPSERIIVTRRAVNQHREDRVFRQMSELTE